MKSRSPLDGIKIVELGLMASAPFCGKIIADPGAEVINVEEPFMGDPARH